VAILATTVTVGLRNLRSRLVVEGPDRHGGQGAAFDLSGVSDIGAALSTRSPRPVLRR
jgi:hypothetical protein